MYIRLIGSFASFLMRMVICLVFFTQCKEKDKLSYKDILDTNNKTIRKAIALRNTGKFDSAQYLFSFAQTDELSETEIEYCQINQILCGLLRETGDLETMDSIHLENFGALAEMNRGVLKYQLGDPALNALYQAKTYLNKHNQVNSFFNLITCEYLGLSHRIMGKHDSALYYFEQTREIVKQNDELVTQTPRILFHLANMTLINRDQISGLAYVNEALSFDISPKLKARLLIVKGTTVRKKSQFEMSDQYYEEAEKIIRQEKDSALLLSVLRERALHAIIVRDSAQFFIQINKIHALVNSVPDLQPQEDRLLGYFYLTNDNTKKSIEYYTRALDGFKKQKYPESVLLMETLYILTEGHQELKQYDQAEEAAYQSLVAMTSASDDPYTWENTIQPVVMSQLYNFINYDLLANVFIARYKEEGSHENSSLYLNKALRLYEVIDSLMWFQVRVAEEDAMLRFLNVGDKIYSGAVEACYLADSKQLKGNFKQKAHYYMERGKALILYGDLMTHDESYFPDIPKAFRERELQIKKQIAGAKREGINASTELSKAIVALDDHYREMERKYPAYHQAKYQFEIPDFNYFSQMAATNNQSIIQYQMTTHDIYILKYDAPSQFIQVPISKDFETELYDLRKNISEPDAIGDSTTVFQFYDKTNYLYKKLIEPLQNLKSNLLIVPEGALNDIPFEVLADNAGKTFSEGNYLIKSHDITYVQSLKTASIHLDNKKDDFKSILAFAYSNPRDKEFKGQWPVLSGSVKELDEIKNQFEGHATLKYGREASRSAFLKEMEKPYDVIHIAMHAASSITDRLENKIYFPTGSATDDVLYGYEVIPKKSNAKLVMITACESGYGALAKGEGTYSLTRAFMQSGAKNVAGSLWSLPDFSSVRLTGSFYKFLREGKSPAASLNQAKRDFLNDADNNTSHPFYWAGLVLFGI